ncbi:MAG: endolytic transglycosylase MltG [Patescibacteria group bacterium]|jgi:UPF0755 protein
MAKKIILVIFILAAAGLGFGWQKFNRPADPNGADQAFTIKEGEGVHQISQNLLGQKLIKSKFDFETYIWLKKWGSKFKAGDHRLSPKLNIREIANTLVKGTTISRETDIRIIEGWNLKEIGKYLIKNGLAAETGFEEFAAKKAGYWASGPAEKLLFLKDVPSEAGLEGYLFPDTYRIFKDSGLEDIAVKMLSNFEKKLTPEMRAEIKSQGKTLPQIITMASLIEKEVRTPEDMKIVSGIFWDRIKIGQPLQSCATLAYILGVNKDQYSQADTQIDSPYNTYRNKGLPPGPIANPGLNAIKAAIYPTATDYNYFLTAEVNGEDKVIYSKTFDEHVRNKGIYLK